MEPPSSPLGQHTPALKEWAAVVHALLDGRQTVLLRKGGIGEKRFTLDAPSFLLFPTVAHSHAESTRPEHHDLLPAGEADCPAHQVVLRARVDVLEAIEVQRPEAVAELEPFHVFTTASVVANRIDFRPKRRLAALVVRARPLLEPLTLTREERFGGCVSWVDLTLQDVPGDVLADVAAGPAVHSDADLTEVGRQVRERVG